jgi:quercetin dioxygenase-like cupin family protein
MIGKPTAALCGLCLCLCAFVVSSPCLAGEKTEIDNSWVRVLRVTQSPHEKSALRDHPASVVVYLTEVHQKITNADGKAQDLRKKANDVAYFDAAKHGEENVGDRPLEMIVVELKPNTAKATGWPVTLDPVELDPKHHPVPFENARVRVLRTILEPHVKSPMHEHPSYVVVYLTELHTTMTLSDGRKVDNPRKPGEVAWRDALKHETENIGSKRAVEIQIELK